MFKTISDLDWETSTTYSIFKSLIRSRIDDLLHSGLTSNEVRSSIVREWGDVFEGSPFEAFYEEASEHFSSTDGELMEEFHDRIVAPKGYSTSAEIFEELCECFSLDGMSWDDFNPEEETHLDLRDEYEAFLIIRIFDLVYRPAACDLMWDELDQFVPREEEDLFPALDADHILVAA